MNEEELIEFLKDNLSISIKDSWYPHIGDFKIQLKLNNEVISEAMLYVKDAVNSVLADKE